MMSVEIDPQRARFFSVSHRTLLWTMKDFLEAPGHDDMILVADVCHTDWWITSLSMPFTHLAFSSPCQPWSRGGKKVGLGSSEGLLLIHSCGLVHLFGVHSAVGENVDGLQEHPHWPRVMSVLSRMSLGTQVQSHDLANVGAMMRKRCFLFFGDVGVQHDWSALEFSWQETGSRLSTLPSWREVAVPQDDQSPLCQVRFLPSDKRSQAHALHLDDGSQVLQLRCHRGRVLPTLVASYRFQHRLDRRHLLGRGVFTWFVEDDTCPFGVRYLHSFEAARCLGFPVDIWLPSDQQHAMHLLGNCVSPVQALWALSQTRECDQRDVEAIAKFWLCRQAPLTQMRVVDDHSLVHFTCHSLVHFSCHSLVHF
eukprot:Skav235459  [mRNA]  locus=scaffold2803:31966:33063:- [translate_table: standard]